MLKTLIQVDQQLFLWLNGKHHEWFDGLMLWATGDTSWLFFYVLLILWLIWLFGKSTWKVLLLIALLIGLADQFASGFMKPTIKRLRPCHEPILKTQVHLVTPNCGGQYGFISSHAANTFALAFFLWGLGQRHDKKRKNMIGIGLILWASWVSYTRIYVGVHYPADVLVGGLSGIGWAWVVLFFAEKINWIDRLGHHK